MSPAVIFRQIVAAWPLVAVICPNPDDRATRTHVHRHPADIDRFALVRIANGSVVNVSQITRAELAQLVALVALADA